MSDRLPLTVTVCADRDEWNRVVRELNGHPLQLWGWGELKAAHRWRCERVLVADAMGVPVGAAQVLTRPLPKPLGGFAYVPRGPVFRSHLLGDANESVSAEQVVDAVAGFVRSTRRTVALSVEPDVNMGELELSTEWKPAQNPILPARTLILDLTRTEEELLADMSKKHRQYVRKSGREAGLEIREVETREQLDACLAVYRETSERADFGLHEDSYYHDAFTMLGEDAPVWAAYVSDQPVAFLFMAKSAQTAFELYGGMNDVGQRLRANYALKWHVIRHMKSIGIERYDFGGLINDGVTTFKKGWASHENLLAGSWELPGRGYWLWNRGVPFAKRLLRGLRAARHWRPGRAKQR